MQFNSNDLNRDAVTTLLESSEDSKNAKKTNTHPLLFSKRLLVMVLLFFGSINMGMIRNHFSIAIVEMTSSKTVISGNQTITQPPEYNWDSKTVGMIISMFSYGYAGAVFGGIVATRFGCSRVYGTSMILASLLVIFNPTSLRINFYLFPMIRVLVGIFEGVAYSCNSEIFSRWTPLKERSTLIAYSLNGIYIGAALNYPLCGFLAHIWGWQMIFYVIDDPSEDKCISNKELLYIQDGKDNTSRKQIVHPYKSILTSKPFWALCVVKFAFGCGTVVTGMCFPLYVKDMTHRSIDKIGLISAIPQIACIITFPVTGTCLDYCQNRGNLNITQVHKVLMSVTLILEALLFVIVANVSNFIIGMSCLTLIKVLLSLTYFIAHLVMISMAPKHSSVIAGFSSFSLTLCAILMPNVIGFVVLHHTLEEWSRCFLVSASIFTFTGAFFMLYGSSEPQPWSFPDNANVEMK